MTKSEERTHEVSSQAINHPSYYNRGIEAMDFIASHDLNFALGNVVKYVVRAGHKPGEDAKEALYKALWYLQHEIAVEESRSDV